MEILADNHAGHPVSEYDSSQAAVPSALPFTEADRNRVPLLYCHQKDGSYKEIAHGRITAAAV
ncbi:hypothetical protein DIPPA_04056 [Diplonema papillatum]|nr:hypothetical protein DIPPA_04056 [Diplonema papillatum]